MNIYTTTPPQTCCSLWFIHSPLITHLEPANMVSLFSAIFPPAPSFTEQDLSDQTGKVPPSLKLSNPILFPTPASPTYIPTIHPNNNRSS